MTGRSLQRRLKDEGTVFQSVRDEMRRDLADHYLGQGMSFAEISFLLGFSEPSAFFRAFKRWTGLTPLERRGTLERVS
jgi:AraC-like DNA-binding protein